MANYIYNDRNQVTAATLTVAIAINIRKLRGKTPIKKYCKDSHLPYSTLSYLQSERHFPENKTLSKFLTAIHGEIRYKLPGANDYSPWPIDFSKPRANYLPVELNQFIRSNLSLLGQTAEEICLTAEMSRDSLYSKVYTPNKAFTISVLDSVFSALGITYALFVDGHLFRVINCTNEIPEEDDTIRQPHAADNDPYGKDLSSTVNLDNEDAPTV